jgi:hypothetical protein
VLYVGHVLVQLLVLHGVSCWCWKLANVLYLTANMLNLTPLLPLLISALVATAHRCRACLCSWLPPVLNPKPRNLNPKPYTLLIAVIPAIAACHTCHRCLSRLATWPHARPHLA